MNKRNVIIFAVAALFSNNVMADVQKSVEPIDESAKSNLSEAGAKMVADAKTNAAKSASDAAQAAENAMQKAKTKVANGAESEALATADKDNPTDADSADGEAVAGKSADRNLEENDQDGQAATSKLTQDSTMSEENKKATQQLQAYLDNTKSMSASFSSVVLDASGREVEDSASEGVVYIKRPGKFRWEYQTPSPFMVMADGVDLWTFDEDMEQAVVRKLADYRGANPTLLLGGDAEVGDEFVVQSSWEVEGAPWMELVPKDQTSDFVKVRLTFKDKSIHLMELIDRVDKTSRIVFNDVELNPALDDKKFQFDVPEGVDLMGEPSPVPNEAPVSAN